MNYKLVPMDRSHLAGVAELERMCFSAPWNEAMLEEELYNDTASFIVAEGEDGQVLGYAGLHVILDEGYIDNVAVRPTCRRQGIADRLLDVFCRFGQANLAFLTLEVRPSNTAAVALYEKHGFREAGRRKDYYENPKEDALLLTREFRP
ncbi:MAG: ribosomal protein S18-alanine N-acetyltransferase [Clostridiales bacterium]|uniref:ribosomal protein S18-alanine N-acetyltransferase n=1 Tax=Evtepia sp. TaxID=2773933 RepID=UPI002984760D|nr:ribosomal protein S18-alanine N-acetyltransferase [Evtepia sp.]MDD7289091.1 ribosomal protein S18-alanine N-acetyltransferase [Clostridiales bacterium]MDY3992996.1 ribosomal protein S18-alanine N-acetyltransferase [Evtepia sp.]MDY4431043.1 ribosomal protein S18-alanine N-acetyltransferase [Evtepia sp.]